MPDTFSLLSDMRLWTWVEKYAVYLCTEISVDFGTFGHFVYRDFGTFWSICVQRFRYLLVILYTKILVPFVLLVWLFVYLCVVLIEPALLIQR